MKLRYNVTRHDYGGYTNGCRCDDCKAGKRAYMQAKRAAASELRSQAPGRFVAEGITHGTYAGYQDAHCRCQPCSDAKARGRTVAS